MRINRMGLNSRFGNDFKIDRPNGSQDYLMLRFRTPATVVLNGKEEIAPEGSVIIYYIGSPQLYYPNQDTYIDDYIHFLVDEDSAYIPNLGIPFNQVIPLPNIRVFSDLFKALHLEYISLYDNKDSSIDFLMKLLFNKVSDYIENEYENRNYVTHYESLQKLRTELYNNPEQNWTVMEMADFCNLSPSYFQSLYKQAFHVTCINDCINSKIQHAKNLLSVTNNTVKEIAISCGYHNVEYFMRQFKKCTGLTPSQYRSGNLHSLS